MSMLTSDTYYYVLIKEPSRGKKISGYVLKFMNFSMLSPAVL